MRALFRSYRQAFAGLPRAVWVLAVCLFVNRFGMMVLPFFELYLTEKRGFAVNDAGRIVALYGLGSVGGILAGGWLTDRFGPRRVQLASLLSNGLALLFLGYARSTLGIASVWVAASVAGESFRPANGAAISAAIEPEGHARAFSLMSLSVCVGLTFGLPLGGFLAEIDFSWLFWIDGGTALLAAFFLWRLGERSSPRPSGPAPAMTEAAPWRDREFVVVLVLLCATATVLFQFFGALPVFIEHDLGLGKAGVGRLLAVNTALVALLQMPVIRRFDARPALPGIGVGAFLICVGYGINALAGNALIAVISVVVWTAGEMVYFPLGASYASRRAPPGAVGRYMSAYGLTSAIPLILAPMIGTEVYERFGPRYLWAGCAALGLLLAPAFFLLQRKTRVEREAAESVRPQGVRGGGSL